MVLTAIGVEAAKVASISTAIQIAQTMYALHQGANIGDVIKNNVISYAVGVVAGELQMQIRSALSLGSATLAGSNEQFASISAKNQSRRSARGCLASQQSRNERARGLLRVGTH